MKALACQYSHLSSLLATKDEGRRLHSQAMKASGIMSKFSYERQTFHETVQTKLMSNESEKKSELQVQPKIKG